MTDGPGRADDAATGEDRAPLSDLVESVDERRKQAPRGRFEELFSEQSFEEVSPGSVWEDETAKADSEFGAIGEVLEEGERTYVVSKRNFCERCRYFSTPPEVRCTNEGTAIREFVDKDTVRLYSCPVVEERSLDGTVSD